MRTSKIELDVDFIGGQGPLTAEEEKALSDFFKQRKLIAKTDKKANVTSRVKQLPLRYLPCPHGCFLSAHL